MRRVQAWCMYAWIHKNDVGRHGYVVRVRDYVMRDLALLLFLRLLFLLFLFLFFFCIFFFSYLASRSRIFCRRPSVRYHLSRLINHYRKLQQKRSLLFPPLSLSTIFLHSHSKCLISECKECLFPHGRKRIQRIPIWFYDLNFTRIVFTV